MSDKQILLNRVQHRGQSWWRVLFAYDLAMIARIKAAPGSRWSATHSELVG